MALAARGGRRDATVAAKRHWHWIWPELAPLLFSTAPVGVSQHTVDMFMLGPLRKNRSACVCDSGCEAEYLGPGTIPVSLRPGVSTSDRVEDGSRACQSGSRRSATAGKLSGSACLVSARPFHISPIISSPSILDPCANYRFAVNCQALFQVLAATTSPQDADFLLDWEKGQWHHAFFCPEFGRLVFQSFRQSFQVRASKSELPSSVVPNRAVV